MLHKIMLSVTAAALLGAGCGGAASIPDPRARPHQRNANIDWRDQVIYQIVVDRFANGDPNNDFNVEPTVPARYHGGDWQGIIDHLDYIQALGVTALWISPVFRNTEVDAGFSSYHGYWPQDFLRPNHHFGDVAKLRELVDAAHARGMLVILDVVLNHVGQLFFYDINGNGRPDDWMQGGGTPHTCVQICNNPSRAAECSADEKTYCTEAASYFERITEWDPEYDPRGIQGWTSGGFSGPADVRFIDWPDQNRILPARPPDWFEWPADKAWFDDPSWYHRKGRVFVWWHESSYASDFVRTQETLGDFPGGLKDLNTENPDVQEALIRSYEYWMDAGDFDGFRIDTIKHMDRPEKFPDKRGFVGTFATRIREHAAAIGKDNFFLFGEAYDGNDQLIGAYTFPGKDEEGKFGRLDSVFYFSQKYRVIDPVFKQGQATKNIECMYRMRMGTAADDPWCMTNGYAAGPTYPDNPHAPSDEGGIGIAPNHVLVSFLDNHDLARFLFEDASVEALKNAVFFLLTWDGIPCIYYGTEQLFDGGTDPKNREDMFRGNAERGFAPFDTGNDMFRYVQALIAVRKEHPALRRGEVAITWSTARPRGARDSGIFAFERVADDETALVVVNTADDQQSETCAPNDVGGACMLTSFSPGTVLKDVAPGADDTTFTVSGDGTIAITVAARSGRILVPAK
ncbi:MAG TPA: alpha-amylase family glycosyl hydrolase [Kofleriaceae bacterium]|nr:alpha-amylase family glycosyl hydrolase [Kofleriaceae bacterium]